MFASMLFVLAGAGLSAAQAPPSTTASPTGPVVSLFLPDTDPQNLVGSVVGSSGPMTTYVIGCPEGTDGSDCGFGGGITITEGASSLQLSQVDQDFTASVDCTWTGSTAGLCIESYAGSAANFPGLSTTTLVASDITFFPVTLTAGLSSSGTGAVATTRTASSTTDATPSSTLLSGTATPTDSNAATSSSVSTAGAASWTAGSSIGLGGLLLALAVW